MPWSQLTQTFALKQKIMIQDVKEVDGVCLAMIRIFSLFGF
jgi:hypothetical protein